MYRGSDLWEDAYRVAKFHGGVTAGNRVAYAWALSIGGEEGSKLLTKLVRVCVPYFCLCFCLYVCVCVGVWLWLSARVWFGATRSVCVYVCVFACMLSLCVCVCAGPCERGHLVRS